MGNFAENLNLGIRVLPPHSKLETVVCYKNLALNEA